MKCQSCGKKEATIKYYENINGIKKELHFCHECASKLGFTHFQDIFSPMFVPILDYIDENEIRCEKCGYTLDDYTKTGFFGCPECYNTFNDTLDELFLKIHGKNRHVKLREDKLKQNVTNKNEKINRIDFLKEKLRKLVEEEKYEDAALIRDEIKKIEKNKGE
jgi:protein arginine kinase activator